MIEIALELLGHSANGLKLLAFIVRDILTLRWISVMGYAMWIAYLLTQTAVLWIAILWSFLFILVNLFRIYLIYKENRGVSFSEEEKDLFLTVFQNFTPVEFMRLIKQATWVDFDKGEKLIDEGGQVKDIMLIYKGSANVVAHGIERALLLPDQFVGEMSYLSGHPASASVVANEPMRIVKWSQEDLKAFTRRQPSLKNAFLSLLTTDLSTKLRRSDQSEPPFQTT
ncbi:MAG: hypothetical protein COZ46_06010 [Verrucomicrobia bacterium CG_4_10_14_3_um_filter_43_23]|nr:MAG: hypothetical protein AUJ82_03765 [Verrucomicrobia bacterium CG1_02_43_26]PIP59327.1 MAG: hypothetical protein COX01_03945 [Verrucomicrobia bacterium CG22_combo_CG10-13_8_21_14_all_43_17]PIX57952.1 MAG: hypothetical protein COZ46_06010 [Verrucomicrobia bacterium CG_4_10_14_3_um_filter_43_23]PIY62846.1 MAG: hypothetical protein COY94_01075 [Verrucomicrobia bacterium CG_4_10_14_0_8_um_filter_43_34]PJA44721.1 MAG: hypothetical protein CO175_01550 [Verrucomicrobia bacterium CG_4_9_14_3_um_fi